MWVEFFAQEACQDTQTQILSLYFLLLSRGLLSPRRCQDSYRLATCGPLYSSAGLYPTSHIWSGGAVLFRAVGGHLHVLSSSNLQFRKVRTTQNPEKSTASHRHRRLSFVNRRWWIVSRWTREEELAARRHTKAAWPSPLFYTSAPNSPSGGERGPTAPTRQANPSTWIGFSGLLSDTNDGGVLAAFASEQRLTSSKNAMEWEEEKKKKKKEMQTKWEARASRSYLISINEFTGDPRDPRKRLRGGFT